MPVAAGGKKKKPDDTNYRLHLERTPVHISPHPSTYTEFTTGKTPTRVPSARLRAPAPPYNIPPLKPQNTELHCQNKGNPTSTAQPIQSSIDLRMASAISSSSVFSSCSPSPPPPDAPATPAAAAGVAAAGDGDGAGAAAAGAAGGAATGAPPSPPKPPGGGWKPWAGLAPVAFNPAAKAPPRSIWEARWRAVGSCIICCAICAIAGLFCIISNAPARPPGLDITDCGWVRPGGVLEVTFGQGLGDGASERRRSLKQAGDNVESVRDKTHRHTYMLI